MTKFQELLLEAFPAIMRARNEANNEETPVIDSAIYSLAELIGDDDFDPFDVEY